MQTFLSLSKIMGSKSVMETKYKTPISPLQHILVSIMLMDSGGSWLNVWLSRNQHFFYYNIMHIIIILPLTLIYIHTVHLHGVNHYSLY